jgi:hypothetical protein
MITERSKMMLIELVKDVHNNLQQLRGEISARNGVVLDADVVRLLDEFIRLSDVDYTEEEKAQGETAVNVIEAEPTRMVTSSFRGADNAGNCPHKIVDIYGKCRACGECTHTNVKAGVCLTCDKIIVPAPAT